MKTVKPHTVLAVDIGNTAIKLGLMKGLRPVAVESVPTQQSAARLKIALSVVLKRWARRGSCESALICSVVPARTSLVRGLIRQLLCGRVFVTGKEVRIPLKNRYKDPVQVGQDRLVGAYAACRLYGAPVIVVDLGTAVTFDVVSPKNEYLGGIIAPGIRLSAETLFQKTALLPMVRIHKPGSLIGRDTESSILSGVFFGYGEMIRGLVRLLSKELPGHPKVVMTGGLTALMKTYVSGSVDQVEENLVLKGLVFLAEKA